MGSERKGKESCRWDERLCVLCVCMQVRGVGGGGLGLRTIFSWGKEKENIVMDNPRVRVITVWFKRLM